MQNIIDEPAFLPKEVEVQMLYDKRPNVRYSAIPEVGKHFTHCDTYSEHCRWMDAGCHHSVILELAYNLDTPGGRERREKILLRSLAGIRKAESSYRFPWCRSYTITIVPITELADTHEERRFLALKNRVPARDGETMTRLDSFLDIWNMFYSNFPTDGCDFVGLDYQLRCYAHENPVERPDVYLLAASNGRPTGMLVIGDTNLVEAGFIQTR